MQRVHWVPAAYSAAAHPVKQDFESEEINSPVGQLVSHLVLSDEIYSPVAH